MNNKFDGQNENERQPSGEPRRRRSSRGPIRIDLNNHGNGNGHVSSSPFTFWTVLDFITRRWLWLSLGAIVGGAGFFLLGSYVVRPKFTATAQLLRYETPTTKEFFKDQVMTAETFAGLIRSPVLLQRVGAALNPPLPPEKLAKCMKIEPEVDSDMVNIFLAAPKAETAVETLNLYLTEAEKFTKEFQQEQARGVAFDFLKKQVAQMDNDWQALQDQIRGRPVSAQLTNKINEVGTNVTELNAQLNNYAGGAPFIDIQTQRLNNAMAELETLMRDYTDIHPKVQAQMSLVDDLKRKLAAAYTNGNPQVGVYAGPTLSRPGDPFNIDVDIIRTKVRALQDARIQMVNRQREAELIAKDAPGFARIFAPATLKTVEDNMRWAKIILATIFGACAGIGASLGLIMLVEVTGRRLITAEDVRRVTKLPVLNTLGDLHKMDEHERSQWAFRAWTMLQGRLSRSANHGLVCGITSSANGEGRSTWISMLAEAASLTGFRVLTISTRPSPTHAELAEGDLGERELDALPSIDPGIHEEQANNNHQQGLTTNVLTSPAKVTEQLTGPNSQPMVHIPLPGWVWNLERRKQWRDALLHWRQIENLVILVELPPADVAEAVLLGSNLPNLVWLTAAGEADAAETREQLETLRHARCNLVGAVLNRTARRSVKRRFARWVECTSAAVLLFGVCAAQGQAVNAQPRPAAPPPNAAVTPALEEAAPPPATNAFLSIVSPTQRAAWQQRLTLGAGDVINLGLSGRPDLSRAEVTIPPDGRLSFLEADQVVATGLTIDELRAKLDKELSQFRRAPRTIITPVAFRSKKYYMLGKVMTKGVYTLDRPLTVLEAIVRAHGFESGLVDRNIIDLADFQRSFLARNGKRFPLNFEKLFQAGDLSQNISIEPGDYLYFSSATAQEVYVVGEVRLPGPVIYTENTTIIAALSARGGYTERAYKSRVLVVRGSVNNPEAFAVDTHAILDGRAPDFKLLPRDIIYVNSRPFIKVEELVDLAITAFIQSLVSSWVGVDVVKPIQ